MKAKENKIKDCKHQWFPLTAKVGKKTVPSLIFTCLKCGEMKIGKYTIRMSRFRLDMGGLPIENLPAPTAAGNPLVKGTRFGKEQLEWTADKLLKGAGAGVDPTEIDTNASITFIIDGGGSAITTGLKGFLEIPFACTITQVTMSADASGSIVVDIWKDTYANFPPTDADSITASAPPTISSAQKSQDSTLTGWTKSISAGDILAFNVDSCTTITRVTISLKVERT